jgi:hypothetical protein
MSSFRLAPTIGAVGCEAEKLFVFARLALGCSGGLAGAVWLLTALRNIAPLDAFNRADAENCCTAAGRNVKNTVDG